MANDIPIMPSQGIKRTPPIIHVFCGLVWPEKGSPAFYCTVGEKTHDKTKSFDVSKPSIEIIHEDQSNTFLDLVNSLKDRPKHHIKTIYTLIEPRFENYIRSFNRWRREYSMDVRLLHTKAASFEASILKIKEYTKENRLIFPEKSMVKSQLAYFSKDSLKEEVDLFAVRALGLVIWAFDRKKSDGTAEEVPKLRSWW
jgi:hypothetical protein